MGSQIVGKFFGFIAKLIRSENFRLALPFAFAILGGLAVAWAAPRFPLPISFGFLVLALTCGVFAIGAYASASSLRRALTTDSKYLRDPVRSDWGQASSFVRWFLAHDFAWAAGSWLLALLVHVGLGNLLYGRALVAALSAAGFIFLASTLHSMGYALRYYRNHFGMGWALPSPYEIRNPLLWAAATIFLSVRHKTVELQDLARPNSLVKDYVGFDEAEKNKALSIQGPDIKPQQHNGRKETIFHLYTFVGQLAAVFLVALLLSGFDSRPPAPVAITPGPGLGLGTTPTMTLVAQNEATATLSVSEEQTEQAQQSRTPEREPGEAEQTPTTKGGTSEAQQSPSPGSGTDEAQQSPSPDGGTGQAQQSPSPQGGTSEAQQSPSPGSGTSEAQQSPSPGSGTSEAQQSPSPDGGTGQAQQSPSPQGGTSEAQQSPSPGSGTDEAQQSPSPDGGTGQAQQSPSPQGGTGEAQQSPSPGSGTSETQQSPPPGNGRATAQQTSTGDAQEGTPESQTPSTRGSETASNGQGGEGESSQGTPNPTGGVTRTRVPPQVPFPPTVRGEIVTIAVPTPRGTRTRQATITAAPGTSVAVTPAGTGTVFPTPAFTPGATSESSSNPLQVLPNWILTLFR